MIPAEYDEIRPYTATEIPQISEELIADPEFQAIIKYAFKDIPFEYVAQQMRNAKSNLEFQRLSYTLSWNLSCRNFQADWL